jgi:hypothetical protein
MNFKFYLFSLIILVSLSISCSKNEPEQFEVVVFDDGYKTNEKGEVVFEDNTFAGSEPVSMTKESSQEMTRTLSDTSKITVMYDGFGNKTEIRIFNNDMRLRQVILRSFADGRKQVFVYGQNGMVSPLPAEMIDEVMNTPSSAIASAAGILEGKPRQTITRNFVGITPLPTRPLPNINVQTESQTSENTTAQTDPREETPLTQSDSPVEPKTPTRVSENLQNFIPKKQKNVRSNE